MIRSSLEIPFILNASFGFQIVFNSGIIKVDNILYHSLKGILLEKNTVFIFDNIKLISALI